MNNIKEALSCVNDNNFPRIRADMITALMVPARVAPATVTPLAWYNRPISPAGRVRLGQNCS